MRTMGIDLAEHADLIRDLVMSGFGSRLRQFQIDPDDALQQVYLGLLVRNEGTCPFDPAVGALSTYLYWVVNGVTCNLIAREWHRRRQGVNPVLASQGFRHDVLEELPQREILMEPTHRTLARWLSALRKLRFPSGSRVNLQSRFAE